MINVNFSQFSKRQNSTKKPTAWEGELQCVLKDGTTESAPVFIVSAASFPYTYAKWGDRFYFITAVEYTRNNLFTVSCRIDALATFKSEIGAHSAYVAYTSSARNTLLRDSRIPIDMDTNYATNSVDFMTAYQSDTGTYVLTCVGGSGSVESWALSADDLAVLFANIQTYTRNFDYDDPDEPTVLDVPTMIKYAADCFRAFEEWTNKAVKDRQSYGDAASCIRSCFWVPYRITSLSDDIITLGGYTTNVRARRVRYTTQITTDTINIPWQYADWRNSAPISDVVLYVPYIGTIPLPVSQIFGHTGLQIKSCLSTLSGDIAVEILCDGVVLGTYGANVSVSVPIGVSNISGKQTMNSLFSVTAGTVAGVASAASGNIAGVVGAAAAIANGVSNAVTPVTGSVGGIGNAAGSGLDQQLKLSVIYHDLATAPADPAVNALRGRPLFAEKIINTLSGYIQTIGFSFNGSCHDDERTEINALMDGGIYFE